MFRFNFCQLSKWSKLKNEYHLPLIVAKQRAQQTDAKQSSIAPSTEDNKKLAGRNESSTKALEMCHSFWQDSSQPLALNDCKNMVRFSIQPIKMMVIALKDMGAFESGVSLRKRLVNLLSEFYCHGLKCQDNFIVTANMMTTFAKIGTLSGTKEEKDTIDAFVSTPFLHRIVQDSMRFAAASRECTNYFLLLRALFRSIGTHDLLYQQFLPLLPSIVQQNRLQNGAHRQSVHELFVELCLTIPVRLSSLLPYLPLLMDPLVCALNGSPALVQQGLRTLELCVDQKSASLHGVCILFRGDRLLNSRIQFCRSYCSSTRNVEDEFEKAELRLRANLAEKNTIFYFALVSAIMIVFVVILNNLTDLKIGFAGLAGKVDTIEGKVDTIETSVAHLAGKVDTIESTLKTLVRMNGGGKTENGSEKKPN